MSPRNVLLVEGGGLRGAFTAGALGELARLGAAHFDDVVAVSSGAPTAAYFATGRIEDALVIWRDHVHSSQLVNPRNLLARLPIMDLDRLVRVFESKVTLDRAALDRSTTRLWIGITDCRSGTPSYVRATATNVLELLRATMALPIAYGRVVDVEGTPAIDGGVIAPVALAHAMSLAPSQLVVVATRPFGFRRASNWLGAQLVGWSYWRYPSIRAAMRGHVERANADADRLEALERAGSLSVIRPSEPLPAGRLTRDRALIHATIERGIAAARAWVDRRR